MRTTPRGSVNTLGSGMPVVLSKAKDLAFSGEPQGPSLHSVSLRTTFSIFRSHSNRAICLVALVLFTLPSATLAQSTGGLKGRVLDPVGAVIPGAKVTLSHGQKTLTTQSGKEGAYAFKAVLAGSYTLTVKAPGFQPYSQADVAIKANRTRKLNVQLSIAIQHQSVTVRSQSGLDVNPDQNASALVLKGRDLEALSASPTELRNELLAMAGPGTGPGGPQIYVDGFSGGQIPPKSAILKIVINQNPFSAEYARPGYGRIQIFTKPGSKKFSGQLIAVGNDSAWNSALPLVNEQPSSYAYFLVGNVSGPITKRSSYRLGAARDVLQNQSIIDAVDPANPSARIQETLPNPTSIFMVSPRLDLQLGENNILSIQNYFQHFSFSGNGVGQLNLPEQAFDSRNAINEFRAIDTAIFSANLMDETHFQWIRVRASHTPAYFTPTVTVQGAFTTGGNNAGELQDHQDIFELKNEVTAVAGKHTLHFGGLLRAYRDANYSTAGANGAYFFSTLAQYEAKKPALYQVTVIKNPLARAILFDGALYLQDDWKVRPNLTVSDGLRFETQNRIDDHADWGPRIGISWAPGQHGKKHGKTVFHAGYGWFYHRFTVSSPSNGTAGPPYIMKAIHQNGINQQSCVIHNPDFYNPDTTAPPTCSAAASDSIPSIYSVDPHFHAALDMQAAVGVDRQIGKHSTLNVSYRYTRGIHQYLTNNVTAPRFDPATYRIVGPPPDIYNYQFQSGGVYNQQQIVATANIKLHRLSLHATYTYNHAKSDTQGVNYFPSIPQNPGLDYGRASFAIRHRLTLFATYTAPYGIAISPFLAAQSGTPYNITIGSDLTENNQFNARPTYGVCGAPDVVSTRYGCLDANPVGKGEKIVPYDLGVGPANFVMHLIVHKTFGIGPKTKGGKAPHENTAKSGKTARRYKLTLRAGVWNIFNVVNLAPPNGTLNSPLFGTSQSLAGGPFALPLPGNRGVVARVIFNF